jgi:hypothetical protein
MIAAEASFGVPEATSKGFVLPHASFTFDGIRELIETPVLRADPNPTFDQKGLKKVSGQITCAVSADMFGVLAFLFLGDYGSPSGTGPYEHVFKVDTSVLDSVLVQVSDMELDKHDIFLGCFISGISFGTITKGSSELLMITLDFYCSGEYTLNGATDEDATPTTYVDAHHTMPEVVLNVDSGDTALISEVNYAMTRTITGLSVLDGTLFDLDAEQQKYAYDYTVKGWRDSGDTILGYDDDAEHIFILTSPRPASATESIEIKHSECFVFNSEGGGGVQGEGPVMATVRVRPFYANHGDESSIVITVDSDIANYATIIQTA